MRFRRHVPKKSPWSAWLTRLLPDRPESTPQRDAGALEPASPMVDRAFAEDTQPAPLPAVAEAVDGPDHDGAPTPLAFPWPTLPLTPQAKVALTWFGTLFGTFLIGYAIAALVLFPAPIFAASRSVPRLLGLARAEAEARLTDDGLRVGEIEGVTHPTASRGQVVWQDPPAGVGVPEGTLVQLTVSNGPQRIPVPDLLGYDATIAGQLLEASGLRVGRIIQTQAPVPQGVVVSTRPSTGSTILPRSDVTLVVSEGAPTIAVPNLSGLTLEEAEIILQTVGLVLGETLRKASQDVPPGTIVEQDPRAGTLSAPGTIIHIFIARTPSR